MACSQLAIGWSNDYLDRETDSAQQPWKPIPAGKVTAGALPPAIVAALAGALAAGALLGTLPLLLLIAGTSCGLAYNLGLKDSAFSGVPFVVALGLLPAYVWVAIDVYQDDFLWLYPLGVPLAIAAHLANTLPDIEADAAVDRRGLAVRLGRKGAISALVTCSILASAVFALVAIGRLDDSALSANLVTGAVYAVLVVCALREFDRGARPADVRGFRLVTLAGIGMATASLVTA
jgi:4-hydroxybenzoate polyprenyltransferase